MICRGHVPIHSAGTNRGHVNKDTTKFLKMFLPKGAYYYFHSSGASNLVMISSYARQPGRTGEARIALDGHPLPGSSEENKHVEGVPIPGKFFGE